MLEYQICKDVMVQYFLTIASQYAIAMQKCAGVLAIWLNFLTDCCKLFVQVSQASSVCCNCGYGFMNERNARPDHLTFYPGWFLSFFMIPDYPCLVAPPPSHVLPLTLATFLSLDLLDSAVATFPVPKSFFYKDYVGCLVQWDAFQEQGYG